MASKLDIFFTKNSKYDKEYLIEIIKDCLSYRDLFRQLDILDNCGNRKTLKKYILMYDIDISNFKRKSTIRNIKLQDLMVKNSTYSRDSLKKRLYNEGLKERKCELCGQNENWMGKKMSLILDHINGINDDNRLENLRIVCANCNATLDTHCRGDKKLNKLNIPKQKYFCKCGNEKTKYVKVCVDCGHKNQRKVERPEYELLISQIEQLGYSETGRYYGVSDNSIRKWKKQYEINSKNY